MWTSDGYSKDNSRFSKFCIKHLKMKYCACTHHEGIQLAEVQPHSFLTSALVEINKQKHSPTALLPRYKPLRKAHGPVWTL